MGAKGIGEVPGQGPGTARKVDGFGALFEVSLDISKGGKAGKWPYWHLDCNAGPGFNDKVNCDGSPIVFLKAATGSGRPFRARFCEASRESADALRERIKGCHLPDGCEVQVYWMHNAIFLDHMAWRISRDEKPQYAVGTVIVDPNGYCSKKNDGIPFDALERFAKRYPRIDVIINVNLSHVRLGVGALVTGGMAGFAYWPDLREYIGRLRRKYWLVRNLPPHPVGRSMTFTTLVGRNTSAGHHRFKDFYEMGSPAAEHILTHLTRFDDGQDTFHFTQ